MTFGSRWRNSRLRYKLMMWDVHGPIFQWSDREKMILEALRFVRANQIDGAYYEFGVGEGYTLSTAMKMIKKLKIDMFCHGFDSFEGLPVDSGVFKKGDYAFTEEQVEKNLPSKHGFQLWKGWFKDLRKSVSMPPAAVAWVDCDLYESTVSVLDWITPLLQDGTIICFDDWNCFKGSSSKGEQLAFAEWLAEHPEWDCNPFLNFGWHGTSFIMMKEKTM